MSYENTPLEPTPRPSAYDHLPPYTSFAPSWRPSAAPPPTPTPAAPVARPRGVRLGYGWGLVVLAFFVLQAVLRSGQTTAMPTFAFPSLAMTSAFYVKVPDGWTSNPPNAPGMVLTMSTTDEIFTVWSSPVTASPSCVTELSDRARLIPGTRALAAVPDLNGAQANGYQVSNPPTEHTLACTERDGTRYVIDDKRTGSGSSFSSIMSSWRWR